MKRPIFRAAIVIALTACGSNLGTLGVVNDEDAGADAGREASAPADTGAADATADVDARSTFGSPEGGRPSATDCDDAGRPTNQRQDGGGCQADLECDAGLGGRCRWSRYGDGGGANACTYDACYTDSTCTGACGCGVGSQLQNLCLSNSNCRVDGDCASGQRCVYSDPIVLRAQIEDRVNQGNEVGGINYEGDAIGYFCTSSDDECGATPMENISHRCIYNLNAKHWRWGYGP
jgi:hypothetical protein